MTDKEMSAGPLAERFRKVLVDIVGANDKKTLEEMHCYLSKISNEVEKQTETLKAIEILLETLPGEA